MGRTVGGQRWRQDLITTAELIDLVRFLTDQPGAGGMGGVLAVCMVFLAVIVGTV